MLHITAAVRLVAARDTPGKKMWQGVSTAGILSDLDREESVNRGTRQRIVDPTGRDIETTMCAATVQQPE